MDNLNKLYCRGTQNILKFANPFIHIRRPKVLYDLKGINSVVLMEGCKKLLIVTGPTVSFLGLMNPLKEILDRCGIEYFVYDKTSSNPTVLNVSEAYAMYSENGCDSIIGFGGGSNIDCAKAVAAKAARPDLSVPEMAGVLKVRAKLPLLIAVPTTAGSGSEVTPAMVISDSSLGHKYTVDDFCLVPKYAVLDPKLSTTLPPSQTASSGMDALTHAVEAYIGNSASYASRKHALLAVRLIFENIDTVFKNGNDLRARKNMLHASYYAGCAISCSYVGYIHAVAHAIGGEYNLSHGYVCAVLLPCVLETYGEKIHEKLYDLACAAHIASSKDSHKNAAYKFIRAIKDLNVRFGFKECIPEINEDDIPRLAARAAAEANPLYPVPTLMNAVELERYFYMLIP